MPEIYKNTKIDYYLIIDLVYKINTVSPVSRTIFSDMG